MIIAKVLDKDVVFKQFIYNESVMYALKCISGDSENDILNYFYDLGIKLFTDSVSKKRIPRQCQRVVNLFYKETQLQVKFEVHTGYFTNHYAWRESSNEVDMTMTLSFPSITGWISGSRIVNSTAEVGLGLSDEQAITIEKPQEKLYKCLKKK
jgi:hypothetical protein